MKQCYVIKLSLFNLTFPPGSSEWCTESRPPSSFILRALCGRSGQDLVTGKWTINDQYSVMLHYICLLQTLQCKLMCSWHVKTPPPYSHCPFTITLITFRSTSAHKFTNTVPTSYLLRTSLHASLKFKLCTDIMKLRPNVSFKYLVYVLVHSLKRENSALKSAFWATENVDIQYHTCAHTHTEARGSWEGA